MFCVKEKDTWILYFDSSTDELISKMESKLQNKVFFMIWKQKKKVSNVLAGITTEIILIVIIFLSEIINFMNNF
jgi:hypothetical protein